MLDQRFGLIDAMLADGRDFLTGADITLADIYLFVVQRWGPFANYDIAPFTHIVAHDRRMTARPAVQAALDAER